MSPYTQSSGVAGAFHRIHTHILLDKKKIIFSILWISIQIGLFVYAFFLYSKSADYASARKSVGALSLTFARSSAFLISFNSALIVFSMCRMTITYLWNQRWFKWIPFEHSILLHKLIGYSIVMFTLAHIGAHYFNYLNLSITIGMMGESRMSNWIWDKPEEWAIMSGPGWTGQIALFSLFLIVASSFEVIRRKNFEIFWYLHHLFIVYMVVLCFHGAFCFIKIDRPSAPCKGPSFFQWVVPSIFWYLIERLYREVRARRETRISKIILHPSKVLEIQFYKPSLKYLSGQYIFLQCPDISRWQWHPFTVTSAPEETILSVHIRLEGDWTEMIGRKCGLNFGSNGSVSSIQTPSRLPIIRIDGPYGAASQDVFKYEIVICIGAGIGQTPFSSILKHIWYRVKCNKMKSTLKKVYFIGVCRDTHSFEWFHDILKSLEEEDIEHFIEISCYLTGALKQNQVQNVMLNDIAGYCDAITGLRTPTNFGRPQFENIFQTMKEKYPNKKIGVFFCGPEVLSEKLSSISKKMSSATGTKFSYHKENF